MAVEHINTCVILNIILCVVELFHDKIVYEIFQKTQLITTFDVIFMKIFVLDKHKQHPIRPIQYSQ